MEHSLAFSGGVINACTLTFTEVSPFDQGTYVEAKSEHCSIANTPQAAAMS